MNYNTPAKLGVKLSSLGIGCMRFPLIKGESDPKKVDKENAGKILRYAIDNGVNYIDTAYVYSGGDNEKIVGELLEGEYRDKVYLATKLPAWQCEKPEDMERIFNEQCANLRTDHIDFYLVHSLDLAKWIKMRELGVREFLDKLKKEGKIRFACFSFHDDYKAFETIINDYDWDMCQIQYNFMGTDEQATTKGLELAGEKGIPVVIMEGLLGGKLAKAPANVQKIYDQYKEKRSPAEWAYRWLCNLPQVAVVLSGVTDMEMTKDNIRIFSEAYKGCMSESDLEMMKRARAEYEARTKVGCTACKYCMPCPAGVDIPGIFAKWNDAFQYSENISGNRGYKRMMEKECDATRCVECRACEAVCPQHISIPEMLKKAHGELV